MNRCSWYFLSQLDAELDHGHDRDRHNSVSQDVLNGWHEGSAVESEMNKSFVAG
jgi:hypothetical protein